MPYLGCHLSVARGWKRMGEDALSVGADAFQFFTRNPRGSRAKTLTQEDVDGLRHILAEGGFGPVMGHASYTLNPAAADPLLRDYARRDMADDLRRMENLPGNLYNFHPGAHMGRGVQEGARLVADTLNAVVDPQQSTIVLLETMTGKGTELGGRFEELAAVLERVHAADRIGVCLDTCHVYDAGYDIVNDLDGVLDEFDRVVGLNRLYAVHLNDSKNSLGSRRDRHEIIGKGTIGFDALVRVLTHPKLACLPFILETPTDLNGYGEEIRQLREAIHSV
ncbi:MAG TPA: deoxyribonuclease IV [Candidatus Mailhella merdigallinarum]|uniref:Probable endonuclease 4 n=1 Tax=Candidatus Mailhella merdigallinarum TaxID=2838658 RepID=A0A9D2HEC8_9BACT|nr:MAG: endonuclease IV [Desulfovibrionaceae bacterium]HJA08515.1 deoxyribonuclease IV [Candidatus Mailhella merdigallinarum]